MAGKDLKLNIDIATRKAQSDLKALGKEAGKLGEELEDTESAGKQMARALSQVADDIDSELKQAQQAAERLSQALGPEFAADAAQGEQAVLGIVMKLNAAGLAFDDIETDADELAAAIKKLDATGQQLDGLSGAATRVSGDFDKVSERADNTRSVVANFAGNATQELPGVAGAMGPLNMAFGQFAEYATEGNINMRNFVKGAAGLGAASLVVMGITKAFEQMAKTNAFRTERIKDFTDALKESGTAAESVMRVYVDKGKVVAETIGNLKNAWNPFAAGTEDITEKISAVGMTLGQFSRLVTMSENDIVDYGAAIAKTTGWTDALNDVISAAVTEHRKLEEAQRSSAAIAILSGQAQLEYQAGLLAAHEATGYVIDSEEQLATKTIAASMAADRAKSSIDRQREALQTLIGVERGAIDGARGLESSQDAAADAIANLTTVMGDNKSTLEDVDDAARTAADSVIGMSEDYATLEGATLDSKAGIDRQIESLSFVASTLAPGNPLRARLEDYISRLQNIPPTVDTLLEIRSRLTGPASAPGYGGVTGGPRAAGGPVRAGESYLVGEQGPEIMVAGSNGYVIPNNRVSQAAMGGGGGGVVVNISALDAASFSPALIQRLTNEIERAQRRTGRVWSREAG